MGTRSSRTVILLLILSGCAAAVPELKPPPDSLSWIPETPLRNQPKIDIPAEAQAYSHFLKAQMLLGEGEFEAAVNELEAAAQSNPDDAFLRFRLATLYLRKGDLKKALAEAETAVKLDPKTVDHHLLLAGLYSSLGDSQKGLVEYNEVLNLDPNNQEALLYLGALYLQLEDYACFPRSSRQCDRVRNEGVRTRCRSHRPQFRS